MMRVLFPLLTILATAVCAAEPSALEEATMERQTAGAIQQEPVDFNHPPRKYAVHETGDWKILVEQQLMEVDATVAKAALERLKFNLQEIDRRLPAPALRDLHRVKVFLMLGPESKAGGRANGLEYFSPSADRSQAWLDPRMASGIVIFHAANFNQLSDFWALKALVHELGHAHHLEHWPENRSDIYDTWKHAMDSRLYQVVRAEDKDSFNPNYAAQNHLEYFAELTATYFVGNQYHPRDRAALKSYDPAGHALIEKLWKIPQETCRP